MKRRVVLILLAMFLVTGCGKEEIISCTKTITYEEYGSIVDKTEATFKSNKLRYINIERTFDFHNEQLASENKEIVDMSVLSYKAYGYEAKASINGKTIVLVATRNISDMTQDDNDAVLNISKDTTKDEFISTMEEDKYTCK